MIDDAHVYQDTDTGVWVSRDPTTGVVSQGSTEAEARAAIADAVALYRKHCGLRGLDPEANGDRRLARIAAVMLDERLWHAMRVHAGHTGECPHVDAYDGKPCWRFEVGLGVTDGRVQWIYSTTAAAALEQAARVLIDGVRIEEVEDYAG